jgi:hypothetical protein
MKHNNIKQLFQLLTPAAEHKEELLRKILADSKGKSTEKKGYAPGKRFRTAVVAVAVIGCLFAATAFAAVQLGLDIGFLKFLKPFSDEQAETLASGAYTVNQQISNENGTLEIKQVIGDDNLTYILMNFTAPVGVALNAERYWFEDSSFDADQDVYTGKRFILVNDDNPDDNQISLIMEVITRKSTMGKKALIHLENLQAAAAYPAEFETVVPGEWDISFDLNFKDSSTAQPVQADLSMYGYQATVTSISISPISIALKVEAPFMEEINNAAGNMESIQPNAYIDRFPITIHYKDGTSETTNAFHGSMLSNFRSGKMELVKTFEHVINEKEIASIEFFQTVIPIC